jgi:hypothetical protein
MNQDNYFKEIDPLIMDPYRNIPPLVLTPEDTIKVINFIKEIILTEEYKKWI